MRVSLTFLALAGLASVSFTSAQAGPLTPGIGTGTSLEGFAAPKALHRNKPPQPPLSGNDATLNHPGMGTPPAHRHHSVEKGIRP